MTVEPFAPALDPATLADLRDRLRRTRWAATVPGDGWERGVPVDVLRDLVAHWADGYDWARVPRALGSVPHVRTRIDGQTVHAVHVRSPVPGALPLLLTHGWPGSVLDWRGLVGPLTDPAAHGGDPVDAFHVVAPSLPGFGFSTPLAGPGWDHARIAGAWVELMARLGYARFGAAGGDTGSVVSPLVGRLAPDRVVGVHVHGNLDVPADPGPLTPAEERRLAWAHARVATDRGYAAIQSTRPRTIGHALADSPAGQLAWVLDKVHDWSDPARPPFGDVDVDDVLDLATLFWATGTAATSANLYLENRLAPPPTGRGTVATGVALSPTDPLTRTAAERAHYLVAWTEHDRGSHFAPLDAPDLLLADLRAFFRRRR